MTAHTPGQENPMELDFTKPENLKTRGGYEFRIHATDIGGDYSVLVTILRGGEWFAQTVMKDGRASKSTEESCDLIPKPQRVTGWMNKYKDGSLGGIHPSLESAKANICGICLGQIYIDAEVQQ